MGHRRGAPAWGACGIDSEWGGRPGVGILGRVNGEGRSRMRSRLVSPSTPFANLAHGLVIVVIAAILCLPFLLVGIPGGYDATTHMTYQYHFSRQFWSGEFYPRWLAEDNKGYGSPIFSRAQYLPFPYFVTALLRPILSVRADRHPGVARELGVYCFLALAGAGLSAWVWFRNRCTPVASTIAAVAYISLPYTCRPGSLQPGGHRKN